MANDESQNSEQDDMPRGEVLYRDEFVTLVVVPDSRILWHRVHRYARGEPFRAMNHAGGSGRRVFLRLWARTACALAPT
jgi:hypothetical protein